MNQSSAISRVARRVVGITLLMVAGFGGSAYALTWNSSASPLTVSGYGSTGKGYGTWTISTGTDGTKYRTGANLFYTNADDHKVYTSTDNYTNAGICFAPDYTSCQQAYYYYNSSETSHVNTPGSWVYRSSSAGVAPTGDYHRGYIRVKIDVPWRSDPSSGASITKGINY